MVREAPKSRLQLSRSRLPLPRSRRRIPWSPLTATKVWRAAAAPKRGWELANGARRRRSNVPERFRSYRHAGEHAKVDFHSLRWVARALSARSVMLSALASARKLICKELDRPAGAGTVSPRAATPARSARRNMTSRPAAVRVLVKPSIGRSALRRVLAIRSPRTQMRRHLLSSPRTRFFAAGQAVGPRIKGWFGPRVGAALTPQSR